MRLTRLSNSCTLVLAIIAPLAIAATATAAQAIAAAPAATESRAAAVATGVAQVTGLAISPLLVLVTLGWTDFLRAGGTSAATLPLHANPWLLGPCTVVLALAILKKCASPAIPLPIRKLLDAAEYLEAKLSALVAAGVLLPTIMATFAAASGGGAPAQTAGFASEWAGYLWIVPLTLVVFASVWITFHAIDALIVLSPFALLDMVLVTLRATVLGLILLALVISPFLALALCVPIIILSLLFAGWCVRLDLFVLCVARDLLFAPAADHARPRAFLARRGLGAPIRTMGHAEPAADGIRFTYRPLFLLPRRTITLPAESRELVHGLLWPTLVDGARGKAVVSFPPRYRNGIEELAARFGARRRDGRARSGLRRLREAIAAMGAMLRGESTADA